MGKYSNLIVPTTWKVKGASQYSISRIGRKQNTATDW